MHESSLIEYTMNAVELKAIELDIQSIKNIHLTCGKMRGAIPMLMDEAFRILASQRPKFQSAKLEIEETPIIIKCNKCGCKTEIEDFADAECPKCGNKHYKIISGNELRIDYFEGD